MANNGALGSSGYCNQGSTFQGSSNDCCGGSGGTWGDTDMEVWVAR